MGTENLPNPESFQDPRNDKGLPISAVHHIDQVCREFEQAWQAGFPVAIETCLADFSGREQAALLRELVALELEYRLRRGERPAPAEYVRRFSGHRQIIVLVFQESESSSPRAVPEAGTVPWQAIAEGKRNAADTCPAGIPADEADTPPALLNHPRYRVLKLLGHGGMGSVFLAEHRLMQRLVALKVIRRELTGDASLVDRFLREVKAAASLSHPNIVAAHDAEAAPGCHFLVMEYVPGTDLAKVVSRQGPLPVPRACDYVGQAACGLQHAYEHGMVHRDIKPQNLMLAAGERVKILDFGLAYFRAESMPASEVTAAGGLLGSADYMPPEQAADPHSTDVRGDIYSLGCTLYFLLAGRPPFSSGSLPEKLRAHAEQPPLEVRDIRADVPVELSAVLQRMLAKDPAARYQTPQEVSAALAPWTPAGELGEHPSSAARLPEANAREPPVARRRWRPVRVAQAVALLCTVLLGVAIVLPYLQPSQPPPHPPIDQNPDLPPHDPIEDNPEAFAQYKIGQRMLGERQERQVKGAIVCFQRAAKLVPDSPLAYTALADAYNLQLDYGWEPPDLAIRRATEAAQHALRLNNRLAEAHLALAFTQGADCNWQEAEQEHKEALRLKPESAAAHHWYAWCLVLQGRDKEADEQMKIAERLAPADPIIVCNVGKIRYYAGHFPAAVEKYLEALELDRDFRKAHWDLGLAYAELGQLDKAIDELTEAKRLAEDAHDLIAAKAYAYARNARGDEARAGLATLEPLAKSKPLAYEIALVYAALGENDKAFSWLETAFHERSLWRSYIKVDPRLGDLRRDERFKGFLDRARLP